MIFLSRKPIACRILREIWDHPVPLAELAKDLSISRQKVHYHVKVLESLEFVERIRSENSGVQVEIRATEHLRELFSMTQVDLSACAE
ncbi:MAG: winged helix-turn-helix domain-containing protein [Promethearchaeota archaeon]